MRVFDVAYIGAGASSLMSASFLKGKDVAIIDSNAKIAQKMLISGGGKCNLTNRLAKASNYLADEAFVEPILRAFSPKDTLLFFKNEGLLTEERLHAQIFCARSAKDLVAILERLCSFCKFFLNTKVLGVEKKSHFIIKTSNGEIHSKRLVVASGGLSYASIGASGIGHEIAASFGHRIVPTAPALVGLTLQKEQFWMKELSGIALPITLFVEGKSFSENLLFAHKGISGPAVLSGSLYWKKGNISIDFLPQTADLKGFLKQNSHKQLISILGLPRSFIKAFLASKNIEDKPIKKLTNAELDEVLSLKNYTFAPAGNFGYTKAEATRGGVCTSELDGLSLESKKCKNLYFIGEVVDVTGELGGFNFQWAFASGVVVANALNLGH